MIKAGRMVCFACAHEVEDPYHYIAQERLVLGVAKNAFGNFKIYDVNQKVTVELAQKPATKNGLLLKANVRITFPDGKIRSYIINNENRICPQCYDSEKLIQYLPSTMGYEDTYIIGVLGRPSVGKSAWIDSAGLELTAKEDSHMFLANKCAEPIVRYKATQIGSRKNLVREVMITDKKGKTCGEILFNDTPGEFLTLRKEDRGADYDYFVRYIDLCDGIIYVLEKGDTHVENLNWMTFLPEKMPVAVVMSKLDKLEEETEANGGVYVHRGTPLVTSAYFKKRRASKTASIPELIENQVVDKYVLRQLCPALSNIDKRRENVGYFAVSSGVPVASDETELDLTKEINVFAPVMFITKYLGIN